jgi:putative two-component system response regulator
MNNLARISMHKEDAVPRIMVVDDIPENLTLIKTMLNAKGFNVVAFPSGALALRAAERIAPDLVLLDITLPEMDGYEVCRRFKADARLQDVPIIFLSAMNDIADKVAAFKAGGVDFITKPFQFDEVHARVTTHLKIRSLQSRLEYQNAHLQELVDAKVKELSEAHLATIFAIAKLSESRNEDTGKHLERVQIYCHCLAKKIMIDSPYAGQIKQADYPDLIYHASPLHDVGKIAIPDHILLKPEKLSPDELVIMKSHAMIGAATLRAIDSAHHHNAVLQMGIDIAGAHHERWDGAGYPLGLAGEDIPLSARIMAVADVYDALRSDRCYKRAIAHAEVVAIIQADRAAHFDPIVVDAFTALEEEFDLIRHNFN